MPWSESAAPLVAAGVLAALASAAATAWSIAHARRRGLLDQPGERRSHAVATPRGGGIGIALVGLLACAWLATRDGGGSWWLVGAGLAVVAAAGWWDDHRALPVSPRLLAHATAACLLGLAIHSQGAGTATGLVAALLALGLVNAWNFIDGIDGLAASQALLCALGLVLLLTPARALLALAVAGACLGFLPFNAPRARVFLGDVGSGSLGYLMAVLLASGFAQFPATAWPLLSLGALAVLADTGLTLAWRMARREPFWRPHVQHAYQRWSRAAGHPRVALAYALWTIAAIGFMLATMNGNAAVQVAVAGSWALASAAAWRWLHRAHAGNTEGLGS